MHSYLHGLKEIQICICIILLNIYYIIIKYEQYSNTHTLIAYRLKTI